MDVNQFLHIRIRDCSQYSEDSLALYQSINQQGRIKGKGVGGAHPPLKMTCDFLIQLYNICCSFDLYSRQFTLCYCPVNVYVTSQLRHSLVVHPRVHPLPRKIRLHKKGIYARSRAGSISCLKCLHALAILPTSQFVRAS